MNYTVKLIIIILCMITLVLIAYASRPQTGSAGYECYPNDTCNNPNTCYQVGEDKLCYKEVRTVRPPDAEFCYTVDTGAKDDTKCFSSFDACIENFSIVVSNTTQPVVKGCSWK